MSALPTVDVAEVAAAPDAFRLDVREEGEWFHGHAPGSVNIPLGQLEARLDEVPTLGRVVCICRSGNRSAHATAFLLAQGVDAANMAGGMNAWAAAGHPVVSAGGGAGVVI